MHADDVCSGRRELRNHRRRLRRNPELRHLLERGDLRVQRDCKQVWQRQAEVIAPRFKRKDRHEFIGA
jgi:hypothetical protein